MLRLKQLPAAKRKWITSPSIPAELIIAACFCALWVIGLLAGLPINLPTSDHATLLQVHFFAPMVLAASAQMALAFLVACVRSRRAAQELDPFLMLRCLPLVAIGVLLYFNFKAWTPLVNPYLFDDVYQNIDVAAAPIVTGMIAARQWIARQLPFGVDHWYGLLFYAMFFLSLGIHGVLDTPIRQRQLVLGLCLNLWLGGLSYWPVPALGPFLYHEGVNPAATLAQGSMYEAFKIVQTTGTLPPGYFTAALGAMPSLHVGHALLLTLFAWRSIRWLAVAYLPILGWITIEAVATGWHYLIDLPAGALLSVTSFWLASRVLGTRRQVVVNSYTVAAQQMSRTGVEVPQPTYNGPLRSVSDPG